MDMQGALRARLLAAAPVTALVAQRVYWVSRPQSEPLPAIVLQVISDPRPQHLKGYQDLRETRVQMDIFGTTYAQVRAITEASLAAIVPEITSNGIIFNRTLVDASRDLGERTETTFIHRTQIDLLVWWQAE